VLFTNYHRESTAPHMKISVAFLLLLSSIAHGSEDPLADNEVTCQEMEEFPELVFKLDDLGSGSLSPTEVDYQCSKSLTQIEFLQPILSKAYDIRSPSQLPQFCTGSIVYAQQRYYYFDLAKLGYYPQGYAQEQQRTRAEEYFQEWSYHSLHNRQRYEDYMDELEKVRPLLVAWYEDNHAVETDIAEKYADLAVSRISSYGFGGYYSHWEPEELVPHTHEASAGNYEEFLESLNGATDVQKLNSLRRVLVHSTPEYVITELVTSISGAAMEERSESPISNAVSHPAYVEILVKAGLDPNHQNYFGKTPLYYAIQLGNHQSAKVLLENGADVNHKYQLEVDDPWNCIGITQWERTPLMHAAQHSDIEMIDLLLEYGADPLLQDSLGSTAIEYANQSESHELTNYLMSVINE